ncbi:MAG: methylated-DNA--[protein]-cysteine S-methyltransferase [Coraliomargarita sp.]
MPSIAEDAHLRDYVRIEAAIELLREHQAELMSLADLADALDLSEFHLQQLFARWAGISPMRFLQCLTLAHAKQLLAESADVLTTSHAVGLCGPGRRHDRFLSLEVATLDEFETGGAEIEIGYGFHPTPFGECLIGLSGRGICYLGFLSGQSRDDIFGDLVRRWPWSKLGEESAATGPIVARIFQRATEPRASFNLLVRGTRFQVQVWQALLRIPQGKVSNYAAVAHSIGKPGASRAVGSAIGANPIAWLIPCHRVLRGDGQLGGYRWGVARKQACLLWESANHPAVEPS